jgi:transposase
MAQFFVADALWQRIEPLLPPPKPRRFRYPGRKPLPLRKVLTGILFVLKTGIPWEDLPWDMGCGCGMSCLNYLKAWQRAGVWERLREVLLAELHEADRIDWSRAVADSSYVRAWGGGEAAAKNPTDRAKLGTKHQVLTDSQGIPLAVQATGANRNDVQALLPLVDSVVGVRGKIGHPRRRPKELFADRGYDSDRHRQELRRRHIRPTIARRFTEHGSGLGVVRWVVERTISWLHGFRRLRWRTDRNGDVHRAFIALASSIITLGFL